VPSIAEILQSEGRLSKGHIETSAGVLSWAEDTLQWLSPEGTTHHWEAASIQRLQVSRAESWQWPKHTWGRRVEPIKEHLLVAEFNVENERLIFTASTTEEDVAGLPFIETKTTERVPRDTLVALLNHTPTAHLDPSRWDPHDATPPHQPTPKPPSATHPLATTRG